MKKSILTLVIAAAFLLTIPAAADAAEKKKEADTYRLLNLFGDVFERVRSSYVEEVSDEDLIEAAIAGMLTSLDPHSSFLNAKNFKDMQVQTRGKFGGLGIEVTMENGLISQLTAMVMIKPFGRSPIWRRLAKSTFTIIG